MSGKAPIACKRCGICCQTDLIAYVTDEDMTRWRQQGRDDILHILENESGTWAGNHLISSRDGRRLSGCPFLCLEGDRWSCTIYETRPKVCRKYQPGSSELCPQFFPRKGPAG